MRQPIPPLPLTPREACACALGAMLYGALFHEVEPLLKMAGIVHTIEATATSAKVILRLSARRTFEAQAGCRSDAYTIALRNALAGKEEEA